MSEPDRWAAWNVTRRRPPDAERLTSEDVRVLMVVLSLAERGENLTVGSVARAAHKGRTQAFKNLCRLRGAGLVDFGRGRTGGMHPQVARVVGARL